VDERLKDVDPEEAARRVLADPPLVAMLIEGMVEGDPGAAEASELVARERPELFATHAPALIAIAASARNEDVRRSASQLLARVELSEERAAEAARILERHLDGDDAAEARAWALSAVVALANTHPSLRPRARELVREGAGSDAEPVRARAELLAGQADSWPSTSS
jgi:hypothetical protein